MYGNPSSGLYYARNRYYHPGMGRFISEDPIGLAGGANLYAYCGNDPINFVDPLGLKRSGDGPIFSSSSNRPFGDFTANRGKSPPSQHFNPWKSYATPQAVMKPPPADPLGDMGDYMIAHPFETLVGALSVLPAVRVGEGAGVACAGAARLLEEVGAIRGTSLLDSEAVGAGLLSEPANFINPQSVRFSQSSIKASFSEGGSVEGLAQDLKNGLVNPETIPPIRLLDREGQFFTLDNRRLEAFRRAGVNIPYRMATPEEIANEGWKFTTRNGGVSIRVRGEP